MYFAPFAFRLAAFPANWARICRLGFFREHAAAECIRVGIWEKVLLDVARRVRCRQPVTDRNFGLLKRCIMDLANSLLHYANVDAEGPKVKKSGGLSTAAFGSLKTDPYATNSA